MILLYSTVNWTSQLNISHYFHDLTIIIVTYATLNNSTCSGQQNFRGFSIKSLHRGVLPEQDHEHFES